MGPARAMVSASEGEDPGCWLLPRAVPTMEQGQAGTGTCLALSLPGTLSLLRHQDGTPQPSKGCGLSPGDHPWGPTSRVSGTGPLQAGTARPQCSWG